MHNLFYLLACVLGMWFIYNSLRMCLCLNLVVLLGVVVNFTSFLRITLKTLLFTLNISTASLLSFLPRG
jgi:uncharacterized membrane protein YedE/YeeE